MELKMSGNIASYNKEDLEYKMSIKVNGKGSMGKEFSGTLTLDKVPPEILREIGITRPVSVIVLFNQ